MRHERPDLRHERPDLRPERPDLGPERVDFRPERADFKPERSDFRSERADLGLRETGGTNEQTDGQTKVPLFSTGLRPLRGCCPKRPTAR